MNCARLAFTAFAVLAFTALAFGAGDIGSVVVLKGAALIERQAHVTEAHLKDGIQLMDTVETKDRSRAKMLFMDDSVLTLKENSRAVIKDFAYSREKGGSSVFNLVEGAMRAVVGKTSFSVNTPTAVAAARGTVIDFETDGKNFTTITCLEGEVDIMSIDPAIVGRVTLTAGMTITVLSGQPLPAPGPVTKAVVEAGAVPLNQAPPVSQQPVITNTTPINIEVRFE